MDYDVLDFENYEELKEDFPKLAKVLLEEFGEGEWMDNSLLVYETVEDFVRYELAEGVYYDTFSSATDLRGAPNPLEYIDYDALGEALMSRWDESSYFHYDGHVVSTSYGW